MGRVTETETIKNPFLPSSIFDIRACHFPFRKMEGQPKSSKSQLFFDARVRPLSGGRRASQSKKKKKNMQTPDQLGLFFFIFFFFSDSTSLLQFPIMHIAVHLTQRGSWCLLTNFLGLARPLPRLAIKKKKRK